MNFDAVYKTGCGRSFCSDHALEEIGPALKYYGNKIAMITGHRAFEAAGKRILRSLEAEGLTGERIPFEGECSKEHIAQLACQLRQTGADVVLAVGGGKCMDASKAAADQAGLPVAAVPTVAATCAAYVPGSIAYTEEGRPVGNVFNTHANIAVFMDTGVLLASPLRYFAAGMADALAKYYELFPTGTGAWKNFYDGAEYESMAMAAFDLAKTTRAVLEEKGIEAYELHRKGEGCQKLWEMYFTVIGITGVISGLAGGTSQLQIGHGFHNAMKSRFPAEMHRFLHGELVGTGILIQMGYDGSTPQEIEKIKNWMQALGIPVTLKEYGVKISEEQKASITEELAGILPGGTEENIKSIRDAMQVIE